MKIKLFCGGGFSTSILIKRIQDAAVKKGIDVYVNAYSIGKISKELLDCDVALLGPQIGYTLEKVKKECENNNVPIAIIPPADYGMMDGAKVLKLAIDLIKNN